MSKEFKITAAEVSPKLTRLANRFIGKRFKGWTMTRGTGFYTMADGSLVEEPCITWTIAATALPLAFATMFARFYCEVGNQETIYFVDKSGTAWLIDAAGIGLVIS